MKLHYNTVSKELQSSLNILMNAEEFKPFRLVGGTALSLQLGHRMSVDIDLFSDNEYKSIDFNCIDDYLRRTFDYVDSPSTGEVAMGKSYYFGSSKDECVKLDLYYTDPFIENALILDNIRLATVSEIAAMKVDVVQRGGRKKDFWDLHQLFEKFSIEELLHLHEQRYPYTHERNEVLTMFTNFSIADCDFDPICLFQKQWELIKLDIVEQIEQYQNCIAVKP